MLSMYSNPILKWKDQFEYVRSKIEKSATKLIKTKMMVHQVHVYFKIYMITNVFYSYELVTFDNRQFQELKNTCKMPIIKNLGLGEKFPRQLFCIRELLLGIGLVQLKIILNVQGLKLYLKNMRIKKKIKKLIKMHEEQSFAEY